MHFRALPRDGRDVSDFSLLSMIQPELFWKLLRFGAVGGAVMLFFAGENWILRHWFGTQASFLIAYPPAIGLHFLLNKYWTFGDTKSTGTRQVSEYLVMVAVTFVIQWLVYTAVVKWTSIPSPLAACIANAAQIAITFVVMNRRIFVSQAPEATG